MKLLVVNQLRQCRLSSTPGSLDILPPTNTLRSLETIPSLSFFYQTSRIFYIISQEVDNSPSSPTLTISSCIPTLSSPSSNTTNYSFCDSSAPTRSHSSSSTIPYSSYFSPKPSCSSHSFPASTLTSFLFHTNPQRSLLTYTIFS